MQLLIDNKDLETTYGLVCFDYLQAFSFPAQRDDERIWFDKSGVDRNLSNMRMDGREFVLKFYIKESNEIAAYNAAKVFIDYLYQKKVFVLSLRDSGVRLAFLCRRSGTVIPEIKIRQQNSLFVFDLGLFDVNPKALKYYVEVVSGDTGIGYNKGQNAIIYWGNGDIGEVSNSGVYYKTGYGYNGPIDIIIDVDEDAEVIIPLIARFEADVFTGAHPLTVSFTNQSIGAISIYSWSFGDGGTSAEPNPQHTYTAAGTYTVTLQVFNESQGSSVETKIGYITVRNSFLLINGTDAFLINNTDKILK